MAEFHTNKKKIGRYILGDRIGSGASGGVFVAWAENSEGVLNRYAIKIHPLKTDLDRDALEGFKREASILTRLTHNNFTKFHEFGSLYDCRYIVMEYVEGITLKNLIDAAIDEKIMIPTEHILYILACIGDALSFLSRVTDIETLETKAIMHGDLTPDNVMINTNGEIKIIDFGVSHILSQAGRESRQHDHGKVRYISPKRAKGGETDWQEDLFALGIVAVEMLTAKRFYEYATMDELAQYLQNYDYANKKVAALNIDPDIRAIIQRVLAPDHADAPYASVEPFNRDINVLLRKTQPGYLNKDMADFVTKNFSEKIQEQRGRAQAALDKLKQIRPRTAPQKINPVAEIKILRESWWDNWGVFVNLLIFLLVAALGFAAWRVSPVAADLLTIQERTPRPLLIKYLTYEIFAKSLNNIEPAYVTINPETDPLPREGDGYLLIRTLPPAASVKIDEVAQNFKTPYYIKLSEKRPSLVAVDFANGEHHIQLLPPRTPILDVRQGAH